MRKRKIFSRVEKKLRDKRYRQFWIKVRRDMETLLSNIPEDLKERLKEDKEANRKLIERIEGLK